MKVILFLVIVYVAIESAQGWSLRSVNDDKSEISTLDNDADGINKVLSKPNTNKLVKPGKQDKSTTTLKPTTTEKITTTESPTKPQKPQKPGKKPKPGKGEKQTTTQGSTLSPKPTKHGQPAKPKRGNKGQNKRPVYF